jgi:transcriptional regulator with XRE-family HTH domain
MTRDIRATRDALNLTTAALARLVGVTDRTAYRWMAGTLPVPEPVWRLLEREREVRELLNQFGKLHAAGVLPLPFSTHLMSDREFAEYRERAARRHAVVTVDASRLAEPPLPDEPDFRIKPPS